LSDPTEILLRLFREGDDDAAEAIFERYVGRLIGVTRQRLSAKLRRRIDEEDVVQSAFRSFFHHARRGDYEFHESGDLWRLLVVVTLNKLRRKVEHHSAAKRGIGRESDVPMAGDEGRPFEPVGRIALPEAELEISEELDHVMRDFDAEQRRMVELRLQGYQLEEIAADVNRSERTVRRIMEKLRERLEARAEELDGI
jgi:RNA polymerase sigma-70 factor (ECF subfamily)